MADDPEFEKLVVEGIKASRMGDLANWTRGDLASQVETKYGENRLGRYADLIGVHPESLREYRRVSQAFPENARRLANPKLFWSHYQLVAARDDREELLDKAEAEGWSVGVLKRYLAGDDPKEGSRAQSMNARDKAEIAISLIEQAVVEARSILDPEERLQLLETLLYQKVEEINQLRLDMWYKLTPREQARLEELESRDVDTLDAHEERTLAALRAQANYALRRA